MKKRIIAVLIAMAVGSGPTGAVTQTIPYHVEPADRLRKLRHYTRSLMKDFPNLKRRRKNRRVKQRSKYRSI